MNKTTLIISAIILLSGCSNSHSTQEYSNNLFYKGKIVNKEKVVLEGSKHTQINRTLYVSTKDEEKELIVDEYSFNNCSLGDNIKVERDKVWCEDELVMDNL